MKRLYCNGKKGFCPNYDGETEPECWKYSCEFQDGKGSEIIENFTNFDRIKAMSVEEMADMIVVELIGIQPCSLWQCLPTKTTYISKSVAVKEAIKWLESEVQGE